MTSTTSMSDNAASMSEETPETAASNAVTSTATSSDAASDADTTPAFSELGLSEPVLAAVGDLGYETPSPVQAQAIPYVLEGRDLLAAAQTGTGKTAAFLLPAMSTLPHAKRHHGPSMLIVTPTRELAQQIADVCSTIEGRTHHSSVTVVGGVDYEPQKAALRRGTDILVATPGRLVDLIEQGEAHLDEVQVLVLDEADRMLDMGFLPAMRKIVGQTPADRQTLLFSATLDEKAIGGIRDLVQDPAIVEIAHKGTVAETIDQFVLPVSLEVKNDLLIDVLKEESPQHVIVFCRTKHRADACCRRLRRAGISCAPIHGNRSQNQRERALKSFRAWDTDVLVATDVLARGIDVSDVRYVVNFDVPADPEDYIHRIGRTGRAGELGWALTFVTVNDLEDLLACEHLMGQIVPNYEPKKPLDLGEEPPVLDPGRTAEGNVPHKKRKRGGKKTSGRGGAGAAGANKQRRRPKECSVEADEGEFLTEGELFGRGGRGGRGAAGRGAEARGGRGGADARGGRGAAGEDGERRRRRNSRKGTGAQGRGDAQGREQKKAPKSEFGASGRKGGQGRGRSNERGGYGERGFGESHGRGGFGDSRGRGERGRGGKGNRRRSAVEEQTPATPRPSNKRGRRPGDRQGRNRGIY